MSFFLSVLIRLDFKLIKIVLLVILSCPSLLYTHKKTLEFSILVVEHFVNLIGFTKITKWCCITIFNLNWGSFGPGGNKTRAQLCSVFVKIKY